MVQPTESFVDLFNLLFTSRTVSITYSIIQAEGAYNCDDIKTRDRFCLAGRLDALHSDPVDRQFEHGNFLSQRI